MWKPDTIALLAGAGALCTVWSQPVPTTQCDLSSEALCWVLLPVLFAAGKRLKIGAPPPADGSSLPLTSSSSSPPSSPISVAPTSSSHFASSRSLWMVAVSIAVASVYRSEIGIIRLLPLLTPIVLAAEYHFHPELRTLRASSLFSLSWLAFSTSGACLVALVGVLAVAQWRFVDLLTAFLPLLALALVFAAFIPRGPAVPRFPLNLVGHVVLENDILSLSWRLTAIFVVVLAGQVFAYGPPPDSLLLTLYLGSAKAMAWYATALSTRYTSGSWLHVTAISVFGLLASRDPFVQSTETQAIAPVLASVIALGQVVGALPRHARGRWGLWALALLSVGPYLANHVAIRNSETSMPAFGGVWKHPVDVLVAQGKTDFESLQKKQSDSYTAAVAEYKKRHGGVDPPPGFDAWVEFALAKKAPIIDDYDAIRRSMEPLWRLSGQQAADLVTKASSTPGMDLFSCTFHSATARTTCEHPNRAGNQNRHFTDLLNKLLASRIAGKLPNDVRLLVNPLDEPRVLASTNSTAADPAALQVTNLAESPTWEHVVAPCPRFPDEPDDDDSRRRFATARPGSNPSITTFGLPFVTDLTSAIDLCRHPEIRRQNGLFQSPASFRLISGAPLPVLSTGAPSTMSDVLFPSPAYIVEPEFSYSEAVDRPWSQKRHSLYWAGSNTGGYASLSRQWSTFHRQRLVTLAQQRSLKPRHAYLRADSSGDIGSAVSPFLNGRLYSVAFTRLFSCAPAACRSQRAYFDVLPRASPQQELSSTLVFDLDGNGISGRYYRLLASRSAPLKQTVLREWHDDRLVPWYHYFPVSQGLEELPELVLYLTSTESGRRAAERVAEQGRQWYKKAFREDDVALYMWRLLLEIARVQDPGRPPLLRGDGK